MNRNTIITLSRLLPQNTPWLQPQPNSSFLTLYSDLDIQTRVSLIEPSFGYLFARSFAVTGLELPDLVDEPHIVQAYEHMSQKSYNPAFAEAIDLPCRLNLQQQAFLLLLLLSPTISFETIARWVYTNVPVIETFHTLLCDVRDRMDDDAYIQGCLSIARSVLPKELGKDPTRFDKLQRERFRSIMELDPFAQANLQEMRRVLYGAV
jgi:hypothetical protein